MDTTTQGPQDTPQNTEENEIKDIVTNEGIKPSMADEDPIKVSSKFEFSNNVLVKGLIIVLTLFAFLVALNIMGGAFKLFGKEIAHNIINATSNPFVGLFIGLFATAIIQSSSTTTSMIVAMVASSVLTLENAIPLIMGANIGTSVTSTIVSMGHIGKRKEFRKAISAATIHDFFNIMVVSIMFPLEYYFGFLSGIASDLASLFTTSDDGPQLFNIMKYTVKPTGKWIIGLTGKNAIISLILAVLMLFVSLGALTKMLKKLLIGKAQKRMNTVLFNSPIKAMGWGTFLTAAVQSSSVTTSLVVPLVATNKVSLRKAFPFLIGANIGTTVTALIAALSKSEAALAIALAHVLFNVIGALVVFPIKPLRDIPIRAARWLGRATLKNRMVGFAYVAVMFFFIPALLIFVSKSSDILKEYTYENTSGTTTNYTIILETTNKSNITWQEYIGLDSANSQLPEKSDNKYVVEQKNNVIFLEDNNYLLLQKKGFCWDNEDSNGKFSMCIEKVIEPYIYSDDYKMEKCIVYKKMYYSDSTYSVFQVNTADLQSFSSKSYTKDGNLISSKELIKVE